MSDSYETIQEMPFGWANTTVGEVSDKIHYGYTASANHEDVGPKLLRITDIQESKVDWDKVPNCKIDEDVIEKYLLSKNDLLFARTGATVGKSFLIKLDIPKAVFASYLIRIKLNPSINSDFIYCYFQSSNYWRQISDSKLGIGQPNVNATILSNLSLPLPPLSEQHRIVAKLEELFTKLDVSVAELKKAKAQIKRYRQSVLKSAFEGKLTEEWREKNNILSNWEEKKFIDFCFLQRGYDLPLKTVAKGVYPVVTSSGVNAYHNEYRAKGPCLTTGRSGGVGNIHYMEIDYYWPHNTVLFVKDFLSNLPKFIYYYFRQFNFKSFSASTAVPTLDRKQLSNELIKVPCFLEQQQIVSESERHFSVADATEKITDQSLKQAERLRQSILKDAFSGKLVPQDPNDEPAEKLLERIRAEREKINKRVTKRDLINDNKKKFKKK